MAANKTPIKRRGGRYETEFVSYQAGTGIAANDESGNYVITDVGDVDDNTIIELQFAGTVTNASGASRNIGYEIGYSPYGKTVTPKITLLDPVAMANSASNVSFINMRAVFQLKLGIGSRLAMEVVRTTPSSTNVRSVASSMFLHDVAFDVKVTNAIRIALGFGAAGTGSTYQLLKISASRFVR